MNIVNYNGSLHSLNQVSNIRSRLLSHSGNLYRSKNMKWIMPTVFFSWNSARLLLIDVRPCPIKLHHWPLPLLSCSPSFSLFAQIFLQPTKIYIHSVHSHLLHHTLLRTQLYHCPIPKSSLKVKFLLCKMPVNWKAADSQERLLTAVIASMETAKVSHNLLLVSITVNPDYHIIARLQEDCRILWWWSFLWCNWESLPRHQARCSQDSWWGRTWRTSNHCTQV